MRTVNSAHSPNTFVHLNVNIHTQAQKLLSVCVCVRVCAPVTNSEVILIKSEGGF